MYAPDPDEAKAKSAVTEPGGCLHTMHRYVEQVSAFNCVFQFTPVAFFQCIHNATGYMLWLSPASSLMSGTRASVFLASMPHSFCSAVARYNSHHFHCISSPLLDEKTRFWPQLRVRTKIFSLNSPVFHIREISSARTELNCLNCLNCCWWH